MNLVEIKDFGFSYPESSRKVLEHVNLNIKEGTLSWEGAVVEKAPCFAS